MIISTLPVPAGFFVLKKGSMKRAYLFFNGELPGDDTYYKNAVKDGVVFCADGGANHAYRLGIMPSAVIGDLDSITPEAENYYTAKGIPFERFPSDKDSTDAELLIEKAAAAGFDDLIIFGGLGGRIDHLLGNIFLLEKYSGKHISIVIKSPKTEIRIIENCCHIMHEAGIQVSLFSVSESSVVSLTGFKFPLQRGLLTRGATLGLSNRIENDDALITVHNGKVLMIKGEE